MPITKNVKAVEMALDGELLAREDVTMDKVKAMIAETMKGVTDTVVEVVGNSVIIKGCSNIRTESHAGIAIEKSQTNRLIAQIAFNYILSVKADGVEVWKNWDAPVDEKPENA